MLSGQSNIVVNFENKTENEFDMGLFSDSPPPPPPPLDILQKMNFL